MRKTVTVVFGDVTGSTAMGERLDPESPQQVMSRYDVTMREVLERHGGTVEKLIGDAIVAVFGLPSVHEDDALRAVRAAAEMRAALASLWSRDRAGDNNADVVQRCPSQLATRWHPAWPPEPGTGRSGLR